MEVEYDEISEISGTSGDRHYHRIMRASGLNSGCNQGKPPENSNNTFVRNRSENTCPFDLDQMARSTPQGSYPL